MLRIGTRGSPLALAQAHETQGRLAAAHGVGPESIAIVIITTTGDTIRDRALSEAGGKGLFTKELDAALIGGAIDIAVHSGKDVPTFLPPEIELAGYLPREDVRDVFIGQNVSRLEDLPSGSVVGSASLRRQAQLLRVRPDLVVTLLRGNVETRLRKVESGEVQATLLALAGLRRLGLEDRAGSILDETLFLPAVGQGAIAIAARKDDARVQAILAPILDQETGLAVRLERAFLARLDGSCRTPIGGHARLVAGRLMFRGEVLSPDGRQSVAVEREGAPEAAEQLGDDAAREILARAPAGLLAGFGSHKP